MSNVTTAVDKDISKSGFDCADTTAWDNFLWCCVNKPEWADEILKGV